MRIWLGTLGFAVVFGCALPVFAQAPSNAASGAEPDLNDDGVLARLHVQAAAGVQAHLSQMNYGVHVIHPDGSYAKGWFKRARYGVGPAFRVGLGVQVIPRGLRILSGVVIGVEAGSAEISAPLHEVATSSIGAEFEPLIQLRALGIYADASFTSGWHGGLAVEYVRMQQVINNPIPIVYPREFVQGAWLGGYRFRCAVVDCDVNVRLFAALLSEFSFSYVGPNDFSVGASLQVGLRYN